MAISLRANETIQITADFHWSSYIWVGFLAGVMSLSALGQIVMLFQNKPEYRSETLIFTIVIGWGPFLYKLLSSKCKHYVVTNQCSAGGPLESVS